MAFRHLKNAVYITHKQNILWRTLPQRIPSLSIVGFNCYKYTSKPENRKPATDQSTVEKING